MMIYLFDLIIYLFYDLFIYVILFYLFIYLSLMHYVLIWKSW